jgi:hypothetical protein
MHKIEIKRPMWGWELGEREGGGKNMKNLFNIN